MFYGIVLAKLHHQKLLTFSAFLDVQEVWNNLKLDK